MRNPSHKTTTLKWVLREWENSKARSWVVSSPFLLHLEILGGSSEETAYFSFCNGKPVGGKSKNLSAAKNKLKTAAKKILLRLLKQVDRLDKDNQK
jgi:hypothetical protein